MCCWARFVLRQLLAGWSQAIWRVTPLLQSPVQHAWSYCLTKQARTNKQQGPSLALPDRSLGTLSSHSTAMSDFQSQSASCSEHSLASTVQAFIKEHLPLPPGAPCRANRDAAQVRTWDLTCVHVVYNSEYFIMPVSKNNFVWHRRHGKFLEKWLLSWRREGARTKWSVGPRQENPARKVEGSQRAPWN